MDEEVMIQLQSLILGLKLADLKDFGITAARGQAILDLILTNMAHFYSPPMIFPPLGLSNHNTVLVEARERIQGQSTRKYITT